MIDAAERAGPNCHSDRCVIRHLQCRHLPPPRDQAFMQCRISLPGCEVIKVVFRSAKSHSPKELLRSTCRIYKAAMNKFTASPRNNEVQLISGNEINWGNLNLGANRRARTFSSRWPCARCNAAPFDAAIPAASNRSRVPSHQAADP